jgi:[ribosomal protein S18]-alanine N-acetyltransferase
MTGGPTIAAPSDAELDPLGALAITAGYPAYGPAALRGARDRGAILLADADRGFALVELAADEAELHLIVVGPRFRARGIGRALLRAVIGAATERGAARMFLEVAAGNAAAIALYIAVGFGEVGRRRAYYRDGQDALVFARVLR